MFIKKLDHVFTFPRYLSHMLPTRSTSCTVCCFYRVCPLHCWEAGITKKSQWTKGWLKHAHLILSLSQVWAARAKDHDGETNTHCLGELQLPALSLYVNIRGFYRDQIQSWSLFVLNLDPFPCVSLGVDGSTKTKITLANFSAGRGRMLSVPTKWMASGQC